MIPLTAREALELQVERVTVMVRPKELAEEERGAGAYAVFDEEEREFLGLVTVQASFRFPHRIFADLLAEPQPAPVPAETLIEAVYHRMAAEGVEAIPVLDENRAFLGVITWPSLLEALLRRERELLAEAQRLQGQLEAEQKHLVAWSKRQEELNEASRALLGLVGQTTLERELLQQAIQALATIVQARYGAIGILDEANGLQQFIVTGLAAEEVDRIGAHPQGRGLLGLVIREDQILRLEDLTQDPRYAGFPPYHPPMKTLLAVPISHQGAVYGRVYLCDKTTGEPFTEDDERLTVGFARSLALALAHSRELAERKRAEEALRESEERYRTIVETINEVIYRVTTTENDPFGGTVQFVSSQVKNILGYRPDEFLQDPGLWFRIIHPDDVPALVETTQKVFASREAVTRRYRIRHKDTAEYRWMEDRVVGQTDDHGNVIAIQGVARDITERKRAEETLRQSQQNYEGLVSSVDGIVWEADARTFRFSFVSQQAERLLGYPVERWLAEPTFWRDHIHPDDREWTIAICETATREKRAHDFEYRMTASDGRTVWLRDIVTVVVEHDQAVRLRGVMVDITDWKQAEATRQALYEASLAIQEPLGLQERLAHLLQTARDVLNLDRLSILLADPKGRWLEGVAALGTKEPAEAMRIPIGPKGGGLAQAYLTRQPIIWVDSQAPVPEPIQLQPPYNELEAFRSRAFALLPLVVQGRAIGVMGADRKHTRRPLEPALLPLLQLFAAQAALAIDHAMAFERLQAGHEQLRGLSRRLVEVQEDERRHLARELHDEVGQILTGLKLSLEMSKRLPPDAIRPRLDEALALVNELTAHARDMSLDLRPAMLDDLGLLPTLLCHVDRYTAQTRVRVTFKHTGLDRRFAPELETAAYRIVQEALTNVARHAGVSEVMVQLWANQDKLEARIEDHGAGFDPRAALATSATSGLAGMRERAVSLGGQLSVESAPGIGARLTAEFPLGASVERRGRERDAQDGDRAGG